MDKQKRSWGPARQLSPSLEAGAPVAGRTTLAEQRGTQTIVPQPVRDVYSSLKSAKSQLFSVAGEYGAYLDAKWPTIVGAIAGFAVAYAVAAAAPIGLLLSTLIRLLLVGTTATAIQSQLDVAGVHAHTWWVTAINAKGSRKEIEAAGNALVHALVHLMMAIPGVVAKVPAVQGAKSPIVINPKPADPAISQATSGHLPPPTLSSVPAASSQLPALSSPSPTPRAPSLQLARMGLATAEYSFGETNGGSPNAPPDQLTKDLDKAIAHLRGVLSVYDVEVISKFWQASVNGGFDTMQETMRATDASAYLRIKVPMYIRVLERRIALGQRGLQRSSFNKPNVPEPDMVEEAPQVPDRPRRPSSLEVAHQTLRDARNFLKTGKLTLEDYLTLFGNFHKSHGYRPMPGNTIDTYHFDDDWLQPFQFIVVMDHHPSIPEFNALSSFGLGYVTETAPDVISRPDGRPGENMKDYKDHDLTHVAIATKMTRNAARYFSRMSERIDFYQAFETEVNKMSPLRRALTHMMYFGVSRDVGQEAHPVFMYRKLSAAKMVANLRSDLREYAAPEHGWVAGVHYTKITNDDLRGAADALVDFVRSYVETSSKLLKLAQFNDDLETRFPDYYNDSGSVTPEDLVENIKDRSSMVKRRRRRLPDEEEAELLRFAEQHADPAATKRDEAHPSSVVAQ